MSHKMVLISLLAAAFVLVIGCKAETNNDQAVVCTDSIDPGIEMEVVDAVTNVSLAQDAVAMLTSQDYSEQMVICYVDATGKATTLCGAYERPGTYNIQVTVNGYEPWSQASIVVASSVCHVTKTRLTARINITP
jgi:hypothetical protein